MLFRSLGLVQGLEALGVAFRLGQLFADGRLLRADEGLDALFCIFRRRLVMGKMMAMMESSEKPPFAPPFLKDGHLIVGQTAAILHYLAPTLKLVARSEQSRVWTQQIQLTISDMVSEAHDTHHPLGGDLFYEEQKPEALRRAQAFWQHDWAGMSLMAIGQQDPVLGEPVMRALQNTIRGCTEVMVLPQAGHFVQEHGESIAQRALQFFHPKA